MRTRRVKFPKFNWNYSFSIEDFIDQFNNTACSHKQSANMLGISLATYVSLALQTFIESPHLMEHDHMPKMLSLAGQIGIPEKLRQECLARMFEQINHGEES